MRDIDTAFSHHLDQISVAEFVGDVPSDTENDDRAIKVATTKRGRCVREGLIHATDYQPDSVFAPAVMKRCFSTTDENVGSLALPSTRSW